MELGAQSGPLSRLSIPIRAYLDGHNFDGETIRQMGIAFEMALASTPGGHDPIRTALAQRIIVLAQAGERDPERLCEVRLAGSRSPEPGRPAGEIAGRFARRREGSFSKLWWKLRY
jgi:hypothetical protein